jgi:coenzyme F420-0:L-glutamate ligase
MHVTAYKLRKMLPPKDDLLAAIRESRLSLKEGDIVCISSKVVSIHEGRTVRIDHSLSEEEQQALKEKLKVQETDWYLDIPDSRYRRFFTIARGLMIGGAGIDESNSGGYYTLLPIDSFKSAQGLRKHLMKKYGVKKLALIITDSTSMMLHRGAVGTAIGWDGIDPIRDYRGTEDLFGRTIRIEMANIIDGLAAAAVVEMGEGNEQTPVVVIRGAKNISYKNRSKNNPDQIQVEPHDDLFAPFFWEGKRWNKGSGGKTNSKEKSPPGRR